MVSVARTLNGSRPHPALALLARETRVRHGPVPREIDGTAIAEGCHLLSGDSFLLRAPQGLGILYRRGEGLTVDQPDSVDPGEVALWLNGSVYAAVAAINGLMPLHASAVAWRGRVYAFTGPPGAGKSTLAAALGGEGLPLFSDDTLILDISGSGRPIALPGHKRLKLWPEGIALTGARPREEVAQGYLKRFADPAAGVVGEPLPLAEVWLLAQGDEPALDPLFGGERMAGLRDDHYTTHLFEQAGDLTRAERFAQLARIAGRIAMRRFVRPFADDRFDAGIAFAARCIRDGAGG